MADDSLFRACARACIAGLFLVSTTVQTAHALVVSVTNNLTDATFGTAAGVVAGLVNRADSFLETEIPKDGNRGFLSKLVDSHTFKITLNEQDIGAGAGPAETTAVAGGVARPFDGIAFAIVVNSNAAVRNSMYWDATPAVQEATEFTAVTPTRFTAVAGGPADGKYDMLTVLMHEILHALAYNNYTDFDSFVTNTWNDGPGGRTDISLATYHFVAGSNNLMSSGAGLPGGKSGRVFLQREDFLPEPPTLALMILAIGAFLAARRSRLRAARRAY